MSKNRRLEYYVDPAGKHVEWRPTYYDPLKAPPALNFSDEIIANQEEADYLRFLKEEKEKMELEKLARSAKGSPVVPVMSLKSFLSPDGSPKPKPKSKSKSKSPKTKSPKTKSMKCTKKECAIMGGTKLIKRGSRRRKC